MAILLSTKIFCKRQQILAYCCVRWLQQATSSTSSSSIFDDRNKFKSKFDYSYVPSLLKEIENKWKVQVDEHWKKLITKQNDESQDKTKYILSMFPYPSGKLHLGHIRIYTTSDILFKTNMMGGQRSIHPMGFDSFGLPAENAAILHNQNPFRWTEVNIEQMKAQLNNMGYHFNWRENTSDSSFYRWTQWLFIQLHQAGLAYQGISNVNWDPVDCTVLADEQVDDKGRSWRSGAVVEKRFHKQWLVKTNAFASELFQGGDIIDTGHWSFILATQRWWIKKPNGYLFYLKMFNERLSSDEVLQVFTSYPELFRSPEAFIGISRQHWLAEGKMNNELVGTVTNPFMENHRLDIRVVDMPNIAKSTNASLFVLRESFEDPTLRQEILALARDMKIGGYFTSDTYRDWLVSRQRFWGTPIPIVHCTQCGPVPEKEQNLPVMLPEIEYSNINSFRSQEIASPLKHFAPAQWLRTTCPSCGSENAHRETDTFDTFFDSSWYFLRYFGQPSVNRPFEMSNLQPVYCYVGGKEHAALHLFYARFITHFLHSQGHIPFREPFRTLLMQAIVKGRTYKLHGKYISAEEAAGNPEVETSFEKMSKSKGTGVDPDELVSQYSSDAVRWTMVSIGNPESERLWDDNEKEFGPTLVFFHRILLTIEMYIAAKKGNCKLKQLTQKEYEKNRTILARSIDQQVFNTLYSLNSSYQIRNGTTSIHRLINSLRSNISNEIILSKEFERGLASLLVMISPIVPCFAAECWEAFRQIAKVDGNNGLNGLDYNKPVYEQAWPQVEDPYYPYIIRFTHRDQQGKEQECLRIQIPKNELGSWQEDEIRSLLQLPENKIEWIDVVPNCSVVVRVRDPEYVCDFFKESRYNQQSSNSN